MKKRSPSATPEAMQAVLDELTIKFDSIPGLHKLFGQVLLYWQHKGKLLVALDSKGGYVKGSLPEEIETEFGKAKLVLTRYDHINQLHLSRVGTDHHL